MTNERKDWTQDLSDEDRAWFEEYMPEVLTMNDSEGKIIVDALQLDKLREHTGNAESSPQPDVNPPDDKPSLEEDGSDSFIQDEQEVLDFDIERYDSEKLHDQDSSAPSELKDDDSNSALEEDKDSNKNAQDLDNQEYGQEDARDSSITEKNNEESDGNHDLYSLDDEEEGLPTIAAVPKNMPGRLPKQPNWERRKKIAWAIVFALATIALGLGLWLANIYTTDAHMNPNPHKITVPHAVPSNDDSIDWPVIDWDYWKGINPDIVGWVTVPGTSISHAIVQERSDNEGFYLQHDINRSWSYLGVPYLDLDCEEQGLDSRVNPIAGHNMTGTDSVFAEFANYNDPEYAKAHEVIYLQTPKWNKKLIVQAATIVPGWSTTLNTSFASNEAWRSWWNAQFSSADVKLVNGAQQYGNLYLFYTCSYFVNPANERTLVYAMEPNKAATGLQEEEVKESLEKEKQVAKEREEARQKRVEEAEKIIEADRIKREESGESAEESKQATEGESASNKWQAIHQKGDESAHLNGNNNEWQEGFYVIGDPDTMDALEEVEIGSSFEIDGHKLTCESIIYAPADDYITQRTTLGWNKVIVQSNELYYVCNDGTDKQYTHVVIDGETYDYDPATGKPKVD